MPPLFKVALTGNIASGKSVVAGVWRDLGALVIEADELARRAVEPGTEGLRRIVEIWGPGILLPSGALDRAALRDVVFRDAQERKRLEEIVHPEVNRLRAEAVKQAVANHARIIVADIPLLFEAGLQDEFDFIVVVDAPEAVRVGRLVADRGLRREEALRMIASQWPVERKRAAANLVIENVGSVDALRTRAAEVWRAIEAAATVRGGLV